MSGFEVAGIVLGSIPLIIEALKQYSDALATIDNMKHYEHVFTTILADFVGTASLYYDNWESILLSDLTADRVNKLMKTRSKSLWADKDVQEVLRKSLGANFQVYIDMSARLDEKIQKLGKRLKLNSNDFRPRWVTENGSIDFKLRKKLLTGKFAQLRGGINVEKLQRDIQALRKDLDFLERFQTKSLAIEPQRIEKRHQHVTKCWGQLSERAKWLFECLNSQFYQCGCGCMHQADLELKIAHKPVLEYEWDKEPITLEFSIQDHTPNRNPMPWSWRGIEIETEESDMDPVIEPTAKSGGVTFVLTASPKPGPVIPAPTLPRMKLDDLCEALAVIQAPEAKSYLGFLEAQKWKHHVYCLKTIKPSRYYNCYSVKDLLYSIRVGSAWRSGVFTPKERALLALNMAYAVLQLHNTDWLQEDWSIKDVFVRQEFSKAPQITNIYLSRKFTCLTSAPARLDRPWIRNEMIYSLGLALLEIIYCQSISELMEDATLSSEYNNIDGSIKEYIVAGQLANELSLGRRGMVSRGFADVARICIWCDFGDPTNDLRNSKFRQKFYAMVVEPLAEEYIRIVEGSI